MHSRKPISAASSCARKACATGKSQGYWESYNSSTWNAHVKDDLEERLHQLVCGGNLDLTTAQRDIATNWIAAYKKYFHTDRPLPQSSHLI